MPYKSIIYRVHKSHGSVAVDRRKSFLVCSFTRFINFIKMLGLMSDDVR